MLKVDQHDKTKKNMNKVIVYPFALAIITSCQPAKRTDNPDELKLLLADYFDGIKTQDYQKMKDATTADFVLYEDGKVLNNDSLIRILESFGKYEGNFTFEIQKVNIDNEIGNIYYFNRGEFTFNDTAQVTYNWLESAAFKKVDDKWKLEFLHSTARK